MGYVSARSGTRRDVRTHSFRAARTMALGAAALLAATQVLIAQVPQALRVVPFVRGEQVEITFELRDGFTPEVRAAILSGLKTTFTYNVDLRLDAAGWFDRTMASAVVTSSVKYDTLYRKYEIERRIDGRMENAVVREDEEEVRLWLTHMKDLRLFRTSLLERNREYYVRVSASARPSHGAMLWPFGSGTSGQAKFTFIR
jgi:hypothetical protein